jgi:hypothetical protein
MVWQTVVHRTNPISYFQKYNHKFYFIAPQSHTHWFPYCLWWLLCHNDGIKYMQLRLMGSQLKIFALNLFNRKSWITLPWMISQLFWVLLGINFIIFQRIKSQPSQISEVWFLRHFEASSSCLDPPSSTHTKARKPPVQVELGLSFHPWLQPLSPLFWLFLVPPGPEQEWEEGPIQLTPLLTGIAAVCFGTILCLLDTDLGYFLLQCSLAQVLYAYLADDYHLVPLVLAHPPLPHSSGEKGDSIHDDLCDLSIPLQPLWPSLFAVLTCHSRFSIEVLQARVWE